MLVCDSWSLQTFNSYVTMVLMYMLLMKLYSSIMSYYYQLNLCSIAVGGG